MNDREVHSAVVRWLTARTGQLVIKADQAGDLPALPYVMVNYTGSDETRSHPQDIEYEDRGIAVGVDAFPILEVEWRYSVHAYGDNPTDALRPIRSAYHLSQANEPLLPGLIIHEISQIRDVPDYVNEAWEPRAQMDFIVRGLTRDGVLIDTIETHTPFVITRKYD